MQEQTRSNIQSLFAKKIQHTVYGRQILSFGSDDRTSRAWVVMLPTFQRWWNMVVAIYEGTNDLISSHKSKLRKEDHICKKISYSRVYYIKRKKKKENFIMEMDNTLAEWIKKENMDSLIWNNLLLYITISTNHIIIIKNVYFKNFSVPKGQKTLHDKSYMIWKKKIRNE